MASGQFLSDLASGIFQRRRELEDQQIAKDAGQQEGIVRMLAGLVDKVEDPSMLMGHIWDTMGIKKQSSGKGLRGFLDAFGGAPNRSVEDQLGTKFRELSGAFMGANEAKGIRQRATVAEKGLPYPGGYAPPTPGPFMDRAKADSERLGKRIVFRDDRQEELDKITARYQGQFANQQALASFKEGLLTNRMMNLEEEKQKNRLDLEGERARNRAMIPHMQLSSLLFVSDPAKYNFDTTLAHQEAATQLVGKTDAEIQNLIDSYKLKQAMAGKLRSETTGQGTRSQQLALDKFNVGRADKRRVIEKEISDAQASFDTLNADIQTREKRLDNLAKMANMPNREALLTAELPVFMRAMRGEIEEYKKAVEKRNAAAATLKTRQEQLGTFDSEIKKPQRPTPPTKGNLGNVGIGSGVRVRRGNEVNLDIRGQKQIMPGMEIPSKIDPTLKYRVTYVHPNGNVAYGVPIK